MQATAHYSIIVSMLLFASCAGVTVRPVIDDVATAEQKGVLADKDAEGVRFYQAAPFLLVYSDGKGGLVSEVLYLPDTTQKMMAYPYAYLASNKTTLSFSNGVLTQQKTVIDETVVPKAVISAVQTAANAFLKTLANSTEQAAVAFPQPHLFRIVLTGSVVTLVGESPTLPDGTTAPPLRIPVPTLAEEAKK